MGLDVVGGCVGGLVVGCWRLLEIVGWRLLEVVGSWRFVGVARGCERFQEVAGDC